MRYDYVMNQQQQLPAFVHLLQKMQIIISSSNSSLLERNMYGTLTSTNYFKQNC